MSSPGQHRHFPKRSLGQNFLVDQGFIQKIIESVAPSKGETVIEIGPGRGAITERLLDSGAKVIAVELDRDLVPYLRERFVQYSNLLIYEEDVLEFDLRSVVKDRGPAKLVANLPYYISTAILQHLAVQRQVFSSMVLMFQKEVVERMTARPSTSERGFLTVIVESAFTVEGLFDVPASAFRPMPKVTSSVVRLRPKPEGSGDAASFRQLVSAGFTHKRKTIVNNLKAAYPNASTALLAAGIHPKRRAETLHLEEWLALNSTLS